MRHTLRPAAIGLGALLIALPATVQADPNYAQTNLVSDLSTVGAEIVDPALKNPWGNARSATSPFWVSNQGSNDSTLYAVSGTTVTKNPLVVDIPTSGVGPQGPTGQVSNGTSGFVLNNGSPASFIFSNLNGTISAWNPGDGTGAGATAEIRAIGAPGSAYSGLTEATVNGSPVLYAANAGTNTVDVFNASFQHINLAGNFTDPNPVAGFSVYNAQVLGNNLFVTYAAATPSGAPLPGGYVDEFDLNGNFVARIATNGPLNSPWGLALAPTTFGKFGGDLLIGDLFDSKINAYNISGPTPVLEGQISVDTGFASPVGLWALSFGTGGSNGDPNTLYVTVGINDQADGLFAAITPSPEPASAVQAGLALVVGAIAYAVRRRRRRKSEGLPEVGVA